MKSHLVILTPGFCDGESDTTAVVFLQNMIRGINAAYPAIRISIIAFQYPYTTAPFTWRGNNVIPLNGRSSRLRRVFTWRKARKELERLKKEQGISALLCCWLTECSLIGKKFTSKHTIPLLCWAPGQDARPDNRYLKLLRLAPGEIAAIGAHQVGLLARSGIRCTAVIENGVLPEDFPGGCGPEFSTHIFGAGSLSELKNYKEFVHIASIVAKRFPSLLCEIAGDGPQKKELEELIAQYGLENNIRLTGNLGHREVLEKMCGSLIFLHPSTYEGNSTVILEAAYAGDYIVCREDISGYRTGRIFTYSDPGTAVEIILELLEKNKSKPQSLLISSAHDSARKMVKLLGLG